MVSRQQASGPPKRNVRFKRSPSGSLSIELGVHFLEVPILRALLFLVCIRAPDV